MSQAGHGKRGKDPRISEIERYYNNRTSGGWQAPGKGRLPFQAGKDGQGQFRDLDMWGKGVPGFLRDAAQPRPEGAGNGESGLVSDTYQHKNALTVYEGGGLIQLKCPTLRENLNLPPRGEITSFSSGAARRFRLRLAQVLNTGFEQSVLLTMTYPAELHEELKDWGFYKAHLKAYWMAFRREFPDASGFWKLEFQKNGRPHYHCVVFGLGFERSEQKLAEFITWHSATWFRIVGSGLEKHLHAGTRAEFPKHTEAARHYISQYAAKQEQQCAGFTGRYWGQINKLKIPFAPAVETNLTDRQAVLMARVLRKIIERQTNAKRWKSALKECVEHGERWIKGTFTCAGVWHHFFPEGVTANDILKGDYGGVSDRMTPRFLKVPKKYRARRNNCASYLGDASTVGTQLLKYLESCHPQPEYRREARRLLQK